MTSVNNMLVFHCLVAGGKEFCSDDFVLMSS
jgi:hypothetical protein